MRLVNKLVFERNELLWSERKRFFITWTCPSKSFLAHQSQGNYFFIWVGKTGRENLKLVLFAPLASTFCDRFVKLIKDCKNLI